MSRLSGSFDLAIARPETDTGLILPFNEADPKLYQASSVVNTSSIDTSKWDEYRQGVEIVTEAHMMKGTVKVHSGEPGHWLPQTAFGMSLQTSSRRLIAFSDQIRLPPTVSEPTPTPPVPVVSNRYDNSTALLWYKLKDAAAPITNSGAGGARDLAYDPTSTGPATFGVPSIFNDGTAIKLGPTYNASCYWINSPADTAWFGTNRATIWAWVKIAAAELVVGTVFGGYDRTVPNNPACFFYSYANGVVSGAFRFTASGLVTAYANPGPSLDTPHLWAATYDGAAVRIFVDGVQKGVSNVVDTLAPPAALRWAFGDPATSGYSSANATVYDCGFADSAYDAAKLLAMYTKAGV